TDLDSLAQRGVRAFGTATTPREASILAKAGVDAIVAQGEEAGGHRASFAGAFEQSMVPTLELISAIRRTTEVPLIAAGGLMDGREVAQALARGASAAMLGTAFLVCPESGAAEAHKKAVLTSKSDDTVVSTAYSGRAARVVRNEFVRKSDAL